MEGQGRREKLRSFALGGLLGAAGAAATARRASRGTRRRRHAPEGLAAFEEAPCFLDAAGAEPLRYRDGGETSTGASNLT